MIGIVVVAHGMIGCEMVGTIRKIFPEVSHIEGVPALQDETPEVLRKKVAEAISNVDQGKGVLILTDMFGGTPSNICLSFLESSRVEVVSGVNLPMLIKLANINPEANLKDTTIFIQQYGQRNIVIASNVLAGNTKRHEVCETVK